MSKKEFNPTQDQIDSWVDKPAGFPRVNLIRRLFREIEAAGGYAGKAPERTCEAFDRRSYKDPQTGYWTNIPANDPAVFNGRQAHYLINDLKIVLAGDLQVSKRAPAPSKGHRKVKAENTVTAKTAEQVFEDGQLVLVRTASGIETKRLQVTGNRVTVGRI